MASVYRNGFDAHTHLESLPNASEQVAAVGRGKVAGISGIAVCGGDPAEWRTVVEVARAIGAPFGLGVHPWWAGEVVNVDDVVARLARHAPPVVGEIGLDRVRGELEIQWPVFRAQLDWAVSCQRPVVVHAVKTVDEVLSAVAQASCERAMIHGFTGSVQQVERAAELGVHLSIGPLAVHASGRMVDAIRAIPAHLLVLETDTPSHPAPCHEPAGLVHVAQAVARLRSEDPVALLERTGDTARRFYGLSTRASEEDP